MIAVIFEVMLKDPSDRRYFDIAANLRPELEKIDGFISVERFRSLVNEGKYLSLSFWRDEESVARWRGFARHREAQDQGRAAIFADYRIRVAGVIRDYGMNARDEAPLR
jgi:heme-degrading monooxygenase HmoA